MHYYQHHIGDYRRDTAHLTLLEHGVYRQLLDWAYLDNDPIPKETAAVYRRLSARTDEEKKAVDIVLAEFFSLDIGYTQKRAELEKQAYERKAAIARIAGKLGGRPRKTEEVISGLTEKTDAKANHEPLTINHKPKEEEKRAKALASVFVLPDWINKKHWDAWHSCKKRKGASIEQKRMALEKLDGWRLSGIDHAAALENAALAGWQGLFKPEAMTTNTSGRTANASKYAGAAAAIFQMDEEIIDV